MRGSTALLSIRDLSIAFGGVHAIDGVDLDVDEGSIVSLIGPNGAGKTTVLNSISGFVRARGSIRYRDIELLESPAHRRASLGIGRTFQNLALFGSLTLLENVLAGQHSRLQGNFLTDMLWFPAAQAEREARVRAQEVLRLLGIEDYARRRADGLPFGIQKLAGIARALALQPRLLLMDEPAAGLNRRDADDLGSLVTSLRADLGIAVLIVEHNMRLVMRVSDRVVVLDEGHKLVEGLPHAVARDPAVIEAYLGRSPSPEVTREVQDELAERA